MPTQLTEQQEPVNCLWYGDGGTGKTTDIASMARLGKVLIVNAESGVKARALKNRGIPIENIEIFPDKAKGEELTFDSLEAEWLRVREALHKDPDAYAGVGWDSVTEIHKLLLDTIVAGAVIRADRAGKERDKHFIALEDYGVMTEQVRNLMRKFRDLPCHFGVSALSRRDQDDDGSVTYNPAITPKLAIDLVGWMDVVCVTSVALVDQEEEYRGLFRPHNKYRGKDRLGGLPKWLVDPTFDRILKYVDGDLDDQKDPIMVAARERSKRAAAAAGAKEASDSATAAESKPTTDKKERVTVNG